jgi:hypothetical protein
MRERERGMQLFWMEAIDEECEDGILEGFSLPFSSPSMPSVYFLVHFLCLRKM